MYKLIFLWNKHKKAQVGETITWIIATIIILVILFISIFATNFYLGNNKEVVYPQETDTLASKSFFAWLMTKNESGETIYFQLNESRGFNEFNGNLALNIFKEFYGGGFYRDVWIGFFTNRTFLPYLKNDYFGSVPSDVVRGDLSVHKVVPHLYQKIYLDKNNSVELVIARYSYQE